jgi:LacI family transcriptional regulator
MSRNNARNRRPTQADVARIARVSQTTVSQILNNTKITVPDETRRRVLEAIDELGYVPNTTARSLRTRKTWTIASIIPDITNPFYPSVERGIQDVAERYGYDLIVYNTDGILEKERKALRSIQQGRADGIIASLFQTTVTDLRVLLEQNIPIVRLEGRAQEVGSLPLDNLYIDSAVAARTAVDYLVECGYTRIATIAGRTGPGPLRLRGYRQALVERGLPVDEALIVDGQFSEHGGYLGMQELLARPAHPRAVFAANDLMAMGALIALREAGLRVPQDVAVMGYDDIPAAKLVSPPLTTIRLPQEQLGRRAAELLIERLEDRGPQSGRTQELPFELVRRESA